MSQIVSVPRKRALNVLAAGESYATLFLASERLWVTAICSMAEASLIVRLLEVICWLISEHTPSCCHNKSAISASTTTTKLPLSPGTKSILKRRLEWAYRDPETSYLSTQGDVCPPSFEGFEEDVQVITALPVSPNFSASQFADLPSLSEISRKPNGESRQQTSGPRGDSH